MLELLHIFSNRYNYYKYIKYITHHVVPIESWKILTTLDEWYKEDDTRIEVDWKSFGTYFLTIKFPSLSVEQQEIYKTLFAKLVLGVEFDETLTKNLIEHYRLREYGSRIADVALKIAEGDDTKDIEDIQTHVNDYLVEAEHIGTDDEYVDTSTFIEIVEELEHGDGLDWRLNCLNNSCGKLRKGNLVVLGARAEVGKTSFLASEATHMASQMKQPVLWINNEEERKAVRSRLYQTALGMSYAELRKDPLKAVEEYNRLVGKDCIIIVDKADITVYEVHKYIDQYKPGLIIVDQLWKVHGYEGKGTSAQVMGALFRHAREWAKRYAPVIAAHQADTAAIGERWLEMHQLYESKTALQGEADLIITIGVDKEVGYENSRFINIPKNKLPTPKMPDMRHAKWECDFNPETGRYT